MNREELLKAVEKHKLFIEGMPGGERLVLVDMDLSYTNFEGMILHKAVFQNSILDGASFYGAELSGANFTSASLYRTRFDSAKLFGANFTRAILSQTDFTSSKLYGSTFRETNIENGIFRNVCVTMAIFPVPICTLSLNQHSVFATPTSLTIGCYKHKWEHWFKNYEKIGKLSGYTKEQIEAHYTILKLVYETLQKQQGLMGCLQGST